MGNNIGNKNTLKGIGDIKIWRKESDNPWHLNITNPKQVMCCVNNYVRTFLSSPLPYWQPSVDRGQIRFWDPGTQNLLGNQASDPVTRSKG